MRGELCPLIECAAINTRADRHGDNDFSGSVSSIAIILL